jgi:hypothetical protein
MKKILTFTLLFISFYSFSQNITVAPTSIEEFNYLTKGYKVQIESGLDMKKGYSFKLLGTYKQGARNFEFKGLYRDSENKPCAILVVYAFEGYQTQYYCIPSNDASPEFWQRTYKDFAPLSDDAQNAFILVLMKLAMLQTAGK